LVQLKKDNSKVILVGFYWTEVMYFESLKWYPKTKHGLICCNLAWKETKFGRKASKQNRIGENKARRVM
jgi:hypothetical protein